MVTGAAVLILTQVFDVEKSINLSNIIGIKRHNRVLYDGFKLSIG